MKLIIFGNPVTKKNSQQILVNRATGRPFVSPSPQYKKYAKEAGWQLLEQTAGFTDFDIPISIPCNVEFRYFMGTRRKVDLTNLEESTLDVLVESGILADDNCSVASTHDGSFVSYDKENPRVEIFITPLSEEEKEGLLL